MSENALNSHPAYVPTDSAEMRSCGHVLAIAHLERSPYLSERVWLPVVRLATRWAHRNGRPCNA